MSVHDSVSSLLTEEIPGGRSNLSNSNKELKSLSEYCHKEIFGRGTKPPLEMTKVYAAQSLASVAYQINTLAANLVELLRLQNQQWGEMDHQINDISQQVNIYQEKRSRHLIGKLTSEKPVHLMKRVNAPAQKETVQKYERHPINFTVWDHIGHGSPTHDSSPASESPARKSQGGYRASAVMDRRSFTPQSTIDQDIYGTSFDVMRYAKKPVAHSIPIAHSIPRTETNPESELTSTSELFVQGHTADSLYDTLINAADTSSSLESRAPPINCISESQEPDSTLFLPSPHREMRSPLSSPFHPPPDIDSIPPPPAESMELNQSIEDLDDDLYSPEIHAAPPPPPVEEYPPVEVQEPPPPDPVVSVPISEPVSTPVTLPDPSATVPITKPPPPNNPSPARPSNPAPARPSNPAPTPPAVGPPSSTGSPNQKFSGSRPVRSAPAPPPAGLGPKLSTPASAPPRPPLPVNFNIPEPPPDLPKPVEADPRIPAPPPNIPKDGIPKANSPSSSGGPPASPTKKPAPRPAPKGFDPSDILKMQQSLKKRSTGPGRSADGDTPQSTPDSTPSEPRFPLKDVKSTPVTTPAPPPPSDQGSTPEVSPESIPDPPPDIPEGWTKKPLETAKSEPVVKKTTVPKPQPSVAGFNPSQILSQHRLRSSKQSSTSSTGGSDSSTPTTSSTAAIPPNYIEIAETIFPYKAQKEDELNFSKGRTIYVLKKNPDEWYEGVLDGVRGLFPANYVKSKPAD